MAHLEQVTGEKRMKKSLALAAVAAMVVGAGSASAAIISDTKDYNGYKVSSTRLTGADSPNGPQFDTIIWRALNEGEGPTAGTTTLKVAKGLMTIEPNSPSGYFKLFFADTDGDGTPD